ncbi:hypothetical protein [Sphingomonas japonica]|uniref:Uncharacterized protein n=1 Tax=Sphingomonas japonica TaxID=511662 RepID=A0ABX0U5F4_9SPHN|nr:hypothetical protein [Sphingomonas japonica]NIJ24547.1 hypothetical protein [Sphingomonas japonica]
MKRLSHASASGPVPRLYGGMPVGAIALLPNEHRVKRFVTVSPHLR